MGVLSLGLGLCVLWCAVIGHWQGMVAGESRPTQAVTSPLPTVVIDAGHGGEDGGASSATGTAEKDINLQVALILRDLLEASGIPTIMTRTQDILLYDRTTNYHGHKKSLDLAARKTIADHTQNCILVSIHMNAYPASQYHGLQVWYSTADPVSQSLAQGVQEAALQLDPTNHRRIKAADQRIYLLHHATYPAILVECGFLSNPEEAERLCQPSYQQALAMVIFKAICEGDITA